MSSRQRHILRVLSSIAVGIMAFCLTMAMVLVVGVILLSPFLPKETAAFLPPEFVILFLISLAMALIVAIVIAKKYHHYVNKEFDY